MSYHRALGQPAFTSTTAFAQAVDPYATRMSPPGSIYSPYGWGPDFNVGMPMNYTHHIGYERTPVRSVRVIGPMYDRVAPYLGNYDQGIFDGGALIDGDMQRLAGIDLDAAWDQAFEELREQRLRDALGDPGDGLGGIYGVL